MRKRWAAAAVLAVVLWGLPGSPLADARERAGPEPPAAAESPRRGPAEDAPKEDAPEEDPARRAVFLGLLDQEGELAVSREEAADVLRALCGPEFPQEDGEDAATRRWLAERLFRFSQQQEDPAEEDPGDALDWAVEAGLFQDMPEPGRWPELPVSRLQLAKVLARLEGIPLPAPEEESPRDDGEIARAVDEIARKYGAVGVQVAVVEKGAVTAACPWGWAVKDSVPMTSRHMMRTASLSKVAVGLAAALLWEEGVVDYDADIGTYWGKNARNPRWPEEPITIRNMLNHTSTLLGSESAPWDYAGVRAGLGTPSGYGGGRPGALESWSYNNHAFGVLGQTLELASGRYLDDVLKDRLLTPLDAEGTFAAGELEEPERVTPLYRASSIGRTAASLRSVRRWSAPGATGRQFSGGFTSSAGDLAKLTAVLAGDGCFGGVRLMEAASVARLESHDSRPLPDGSWQALPLRLRRDLYGRERLYYHTGSAYGVYHLLSYDPDTGDGVVVLTMGASGEKDAQGIYAVCGEISEAAYRAIR